MRQESGSNEMMVFACEVVNGVRLVAEMIYDKATNGVNVRLTGPNDTYLAYFHHALSIVVNL